ncbi:unnamed protein product [Trichogramma brassicae]|uniref:Uncharacterized protein n=1 Tax=Trichogramma brassicae TaxID=86971 RepID=A0A6H5J539_9HYME|nr:unnamed protein product [Trichogramma brassicae]
MLLAENSNLQQPLWGRPVPQQYRTSPLPADRPAAASPHPRPLYTPGYFTYRTNYNALTRHDTLAIPLSRKSSSPNRPYRPAHTHTHHNTIQPCAIMWRFEKQRGKYIDSTRTVYKFTRKDHTFHVEFCQFIHVDFLRRSTRIFWSSKK